MNELTVPQKDKKIQEYVRLINEGHREEYALRELNYALNEFGPILSALVSLAPVGLFIALHSLSVLSLVPCIVAGALCFGGSLWGCFVAHTNLQYNRNKILSKLDEKSQQELLKLLEYNNLKRTLKAKYERDPDLFVMTHFGVYNYELVLRIKSEMEKGAGSDYLIELTKPESQTHRDLKSKINPENAIKVGCKV